MISIASMTTASSISISCSTPDLPTNAKTSRSWCRRTCRRSSVVSPKRAVLVGVDVVADPEVAEVEQAYGGRAGPLERHPLAAEVGEHQLARLGQRLAEHQHPVELLRVPPGPPVRVVEVLPPAGVVGADRLQVAVVVRRDPDVRPRRRDHQVADPLRVVLGQPRRRARRGRRTRARPGGGSSRAGRARCYAA